MRAVVTALSALALATMSLGLAEARIHHPIVVLHPHRTHHPILVTHPVRVLHPILHITHPHHR